MLVPPARAIVRAVPRTYPECLRERPDAIDLEAARAEHAAYVAALREAGVEVEFAPPLDDAPDSVFVEDAAVVLDRTAVATRPGAPSRRAEVEGVAEVLAGRFEVATMPAPATLDGGDVLRVGRRLFAGLSGRSNREGFEFLAAAAAREGLEAIPVPVERGLHLKSACTLAAEGVLVHLEGALDPAPFAAAGLALVATREPAGANVLALGRIVLVSAAAPRTRERLEALGLDARPVGIDSFHRGDGALTCLSVRIAPPGSGWVT